MLLYRTSVGPVLEVGESRQALSEDWNDLLKRDDLPEYLADLKGEQVVGALEPLSVCTSQEVWAAGVTYFRSRTARMEESKDSGGGTFYDRVYAAERPEIFFKATPHRVAAHGGTMHLRRDSAWMVPEPEMTLVVSAGGRLIGTTIGNDLSCRDIEGENPLYLPQAKCFRTSAALGPCIRVSAEPLPAETEIMIEILRGGAKVFAGETTLAQLKRSPQELIEFLYRDNDFPQGAFLMTGTGIVPGDDFTLAISDEVRIRISGIGLLSNVMA